MPIFRYMLGSVHSCIAHSKTGLKIIEKLHNQCEAVIARAHGIDNPTMERTGEAELICSLNKEIHRFIDVGANQGEWSASLLAQSPGAHGLLFDPSGSAVSALTKRFASNGCLKIIGKAVSDSIGEMEFYEEPAAGETSSLIRAVSNNALARKVEITTLDAELAQAGWDEIDYLKIDAEGFDFYVLRGAKDLFNNRRIRFGQFEYGEGWRYAGSTLRHAHDWLGNLGYSTYLINKTGISAANPDRFREYFRYSNYVFVRSDLKGQFESMVSAAFNSVPARLLV